MEPPTTARPLIRTGPSFTSTHDPRKPTDPLYPCFFTSSPKINFMMSAPTSPTVSSESVERPELGDHTISAGSGHTRGLSSEDKPKNQRRSIQFSIAEAQLPSRPSSFKEKRLSYGDTPSRELLEEKEREHKAAQLNRGPSPPPPKYAPLKVTEMPCTNIWQNLRARRLF